MNGQTGEVCLNAWKAIESVRLLSDNISVRRCGRAMNNMFYVHGNVILFTVARRTSVYTIFIIAWKYFQSLYTSVTSKSCFVKP